MPSQLKTKEIENNETDRIEPKSMHLRNFDFTKALMDPSVEVPEGIGKGQNSSFRNSPKRFDVYRNNVIVSLIEALKSAYPSILAILGNDNFEKVARIYVAEHPPKSAMMQNYGDRFSNFLENFHPLKASPFLIDLAKVEFAWQTAFNAKDEAPLDPLIINKFPQETIMILTFKFHPAAQLIASEYAISDLFQQRFGESEKDINIEEPQCVLITRPQLDLQLYEIPIDNYIFQEKLKLGHPLEVASQAGFQTNPEFDLSNAIALLLQSGALSTATIKTQEDK